MNPLSIVIVGCLSALTGAFVTALLMKNARAEIAKLAAGIVSDTPAEHTGPHITVNVPANWQPMEPLPSDQTISGARAQLWYSTFKASLDEGSSYSTTAANVADQAVRICFPS